MTFANKITLFRIISIPFFIATLIFYTPERPYLRFLALGIFLMRSSQTSSTVTSPGTIARRQRPERSLIRWPTRHFF